MRGGRPARWPRNAVPRPWTCGSNMVSVIMAEEHQVLLDDRRRPPGRAALALVDAALGLVSAAHEPSCARVRGARRRGKSCGHESRAHDRATREPDAQRRYKLRVITKSYAIKSALRSKKLWPVLLRRRRGRGGPWGHLKSFHPVKRESHTLLYASPRPGRLSRPTQAGNVRDCGRLGDRKRAASTTRVTGV